MKISKDSWHLKLVNFFQGESYEWMIKNQGISNCQHIRSVLLFSFLTLICIAAVMVVCLIAFIGYVALPLWCFFDIQFFDLSKESTGIFADTLPLAIMVNFVTFGGLGYFLIKKALKKWLRNRPEKPIDKPDGLIKSYLKSKNEKICSKVEIVEGED